MPGHPRASGRVQSQSAHRISGLFPGDQVRPHCGLHPTFDDLEPKAGPRSGGPPSHWSHRIRSRGGIVHAEFDRLLERLQQRVVPRMQADRDPARRRRLAFPQQMALLRPTFGDLLRQVFAATEFDTKCCCAESISPVARRRARRSIGCWGARPFLWVRGLRGAPRGGSQQGLLHRAPAEERDLSGGRARWRQSAVAIAEVGLHSAAYIGWRYLVLGVIALLVSYSANASYIDDVEAAVADLKSTELGAGARACRSRRSCPARCLRGVTDVAEKYKSDVPLRMRWAFTGATHRSSRAGRVSARRQWGLPPFLPAFEQELPGSVATPDRLYEFLKGYLMLADASHRDLPTSGPCGCRVESAVSR